MAILNLQVQSLTTERGPGTPTVMIKARASVVPSLFTEDQGDEKSWHLLEDWVGSFWKRNCKFQPEIDSCSTIRSDVFGNFSGTEMCGDFCLFSNLQMLYGQLHCIFQFTGHMDTAFVYTRSWEKLSGEQLWQNIQLQLGAIYRGS